MLRKGIFIALALAGSWAGGSLSCGAGSIFSGLGYGSLEDFASTRASGLGNAGLALEDSLTLNALNPALLADLDGTRAAISAHLMRQWLSDQQNSETQDAGQFDYFAFGFPLRRGLALGFMLSPFSRRDYNYGWQGQLSGTSYFQNDRGTGGLSRAQLNLAWAPVRSVKLGAAGAVIWGNGEEIRGSYFESSGYQDIEFVTSKQWMAFGGTFGLILRPQANLTFGAIVEPEVPIHLDQSYTYTGEDSSVTSQTDFRLAGRYGLGSTWRLSPHWLTAGSILYGDWGTKNPLPTGTSYQNSYSLALGAEYVPGAWNAERFFKRLQYRLGGRWESSYVQSNGQAVNGYFGTVGIGYPIRQGRERIDLALECGQRGSLSANLGQETILKFRVGLTLGETWFQRPKPTWEN